MPEQTLTVGQIWESDDGTRWEVLRGPTTRAELGLPTEGEWGRIVPDDGLVEIVQVSPPQLRVCMAWVFTDGKRRVRRKAGESASQREGGE